MRIDVNDNMVDMHHEIIELKYITSKLERLLFDFYDYLYRYKHDHEEEQAYVIRQIEETKELRRMICNLQEDTAHYNGEIMHLPDRIANLEEEIDELKRENEEKQRTNYILHQLVAVSQKFSSSSFTRRGSASLDDYYGVIGILFAEYDKIPVREYIADYFTLLDGDSAQYIDFLLPGYSYNDSPEPDCHKVDNVFLYGKQIYYHKEDFYKCLKDYREFFGIDYFDKPVLVLHEIDNGKVSPRRIILELGYKEAKKLFDKIIKAAKQYTDLDDFSAELQDIDICIILKVLKILASHYVVDIDEVESDIKDVYRFRVRQ